MKSLIRFFYGNHLFGNLLTAVILVVGLYSVFSIRKDLFPSVDFDTTIITAIFPGASPDQVEKLILNPIEQAVKEVDGIKKVQSQALDSRAIITVILDPDSRDPDKTNDQIQRAVDQVENYPAEAERPLVLQLESGMTPVIQLSIASDTLSEIQLRDAAKYIVDELTNVPGVAKVQKDAWRRREIQAWVDQEKLSRHHVSLSQVVSAIRQQNIQLPAGDMILPSGTEVSVKTDGEFRTVDDVKKTYIRSNWEGLGVKIGDVAEVREGLERASVLYKTNGSPAIRLTILKKEKADALKTVAAVREKMTSLESRLPQGLDYLFVNDFTYYLNNRLGTLQSNMIVGILLVCGILALFLPFRVALVVAIGIPFSMFLAILTIQYLGYSLNLISLIGLIIVSGMLVDDTVVVTENIYRRLESGEDMETAIVEGTTEMVPAVLASVLTTTAAFGPMLFMSGIFGKFIFEIPLLVILPLLYSLFEAFAVAPGHILTIVGNSVKTSLHQKREDSGKTHWYDRVLPRYTALIDWTIRYRYRTFAGFMGLLVFTGALTTQMRFVLFPPEGIYSFFIRVDGPAGATLADMEKITQQIEPEIEKLPKEELFDYTTVLGLQQQDGNDPFSKRAPHYAQIQVNLSPEDQRLRTVDEVVNDLREKIQKPAGAEKMNFQIAQGGPPQGRPISINIYGEDFVVLRQIGAKIKEVMASVEGVQDIQDSEVIGKKEIRVVPKPGLVSQVGLSTQEIAQSVRATFAGLVASSSRSLDEEIDVRVQLKPPPMEADQQLKGIRIGNTRGDLIPLHRIAEFEEGDSRLIIQHERYKRILNVSAEVDLEKSTPLAATAVLQEKLKDVLKEFPQYEISFGGSNEDTEESLGSLGRAFAVAAILIFCILVLTFQSFLQPLLVLLAIPFGFVGVVFALLIHGRPLSFMALLGVIALAGVIVNNAIVYIDFFNARRKAGDDLHTALLTAATTRLRPILLTSLTTVLGLMPTAYGIGGSDGFVMALALALGWGLMIGSTLTLILFPALLRIVEDGKDWGHRMWLRLLRKGSPAKIAE